MIRLQFKTVKISYNNSLSKAYNLKISVMALKSNHLLRPKIITDSNRYYTLTNWNVIHQDDKNVALK